MSFRRLCCGGLALAVLSCSSTPPPTSSPPPLSEPAVSATPTSIHSVGLRVFQDELLAAGNVSADPSRQGRVGAPTSGRITEVYVATGDRVRRGQPLARFHSPDLTRARADHEHAQLRLELATRTLEQRRQAFQLGDSSQRPVEEARNEVATSKGEEAVARSALDLSRSKLQRVEDLVSHGVSPRQELDEARAAVRQAEARWRQAREVLGVARSHSRREERLNAAGSLVMPRLLEAENELKLAQEEVRHSAHVLYDLGQPEADGLTLRAPRDGVVVSCQAVQGQAITANESLFEVLDSSKLWLWIYLYEADQSRVRMDMPVTVVVEALPGRQFEGRISYLPPQVEIPSRALRARVVVDNPSGLLKVGMAARVKVALGPPRKSPAIPLEALVEGDKVMVEGQTQPRKVKVGLRQENWVEVLQGLELGERVVSQGGYLLESEAP